jgi:hypothetical protein
MRYVAPCVFGKSYDTTPTPTQYQGLTNWYVIPLGWVCRRNDDGTMTASPNKDFSNPTFDVKIDTDGFMKFQSMGYNAQTTPI